MLLAAHSKGYAGYWRTPGVLWTDSGRKAVGLPPDERVVGLLYLGRPVQGQRPPERGPVSDTVVYLD